jgi:hypothetical protein
MNEKGLEIHSSTLDRVADAHQTNVGVCRFLSTSIDNRLDGQDDAELRSEVEVGAGCRMKSCQQLVLGRKMGEKGAGLSTDRALRASQTGRPLGDAATQRRTIPSLSH